MNTLKNFLKKPFASKALDLNSNPSAKLSEEDSISRVGSTEIDSINIELTSTSLLYQMYSEENEALFI